MAQLVAPGARIAAALGVSCGARRMPLHRRQCLNSPELLGGGVRGGNARAVAENDLNRRKSPGWIWFSSCSSWLWC